ncbi:MAG: TetR/AcrR family transcriptional regulator [Paludibacter sp.]|nr:TetR/AcrR family transcriptional regulator [Paludibacter sp.]MDD4199317.1 TetR/AcrR family transcriptional regulator [Paludibacter sp.]MDD4428300.1 TetR/AcrR family transcriptional regulator [Paludibacter sp.]
MKVNKFKRKYTGKAISVFKQYGLRLSLEEVASKMGITKKTLYNHFASKDELLKDCIQSISVDFQEAISGLDDRTNSAIENLRIGFVRITDYFTELSPVFFFDIMHLDPNQAMSEHLIGSKLFQHKIEANLKQGIDEGFYRGDLDTDFISRQLAYSIFGFYINNIINNNIMLSQSYFNDIIEFNLRALVSEKGMEFL